MLIEIMNMPIKSAHVFCKAESFEVWTTRQTIRHQTAFIFARTKRSKAIVPEDDVTGS